MRHLRTWVAALVLAAFALSPAACFAQSSYAKVQTPWYQQGKISGGISVTGSTAATALPATGFTAWVCNTGANDAYLSFGTDNTVTATTTGSSWLKAGTCGNYDLNPVLTKLSWVAAITASSTTTLAVETGLGVGPAQPGSSGGGGGAVTQSGTWTMQPGNTANTTPWLMTVNQGGNSASVTGANALKVDGSAVTQPVSGTVTAAQATAANLNATVVGTGTFATQAAPTPVTSGGLSVYFVQPTASDNHANIKNGAGQVYKVSVTNNSATVNYLRLYDAGTGFNGCNSATNLKYQFLIPGSTSGAGVSDSWDLGMSFSTGISICVTSGYATTDTTNATASAMSVNLGYK